jgi:hypothetical protein
VKSVCPRRNNEEEEEEEGERKEKPQIAADSFCFSCERGWLFGPRFLRVG